MPDLRRGVRSAVRPAERAEQKPNQIPVRGSNAPWHPRSSTVLTRYVEISNIRVSLRPGRPQNFSADNRLGTGLEVLPPRQASHCSMRTGFGIGPPRACAGAAPADCAESRQVSRKPAGEWRGAAAPFLDGRSDVSSAFHSSSLPVAATS